LKTNHLATLVPAITATAVLGCQIFLVTIYQNGGKYTKLTQNYQTPIECTKWPYNIPNGQDTNLSHTKFTQIGIFVLKIYHLATLQPCSSVSGNVLKQ
jgi:hypothetical protein